MQTDNFDELKNLWQSKKDSYEFKDSEIIESVKERLKINQRKLIFSNLFVSVSFAIVFIVIGWIWNSFPDRTLYFYLSLSFMGFILISLLTVMWAGVTFSNIDPSIETDEFIQKSIKKIKIRIFSLKYALPVFLFFLLITFFFYYADVLAYETILIKVTAYTATTVYSLLVTILSNKKRKRNLKENYELIEYLKWWQNTER